MTAARLLKTLLSRRRLLSTGGLAISACASGATAVEERTLPSFFGPGLDPRTSDCSAALAAAWRWSAETGGAVRVVGRFRLERTARLVESAGRFVFDAAVFDIFEARLSGELSNGAKGPIGVLCTARGARMTGRLTLMGRGVPGRTAMAGIVFDGADGAEIGDLSVSNMAAGRIVLWCRDASFGDIVAADMRGVQSFGQGTAGSADVIIGCTDCRFGTVASTRNYKPVRYLSVAVDGKGVRRDTLRCQFGETSGTAYPQSPESMILAIRSAVECRFGSVSGIGFGQGVAFISYVGDDGFSVRDNYVAAIRVEDGDTPASVDAALAIDREAGAPAIGRQTIDYLKAIRGGYYGIFANDGELIVKTAIIDTAVRPVQLRDCIVQFGTVTITGTYVSAFGYGKGVRGAIDRLIVEGGSTVAGANAVQNFPGERTRGLRFRTIVYRPTARGRPLARIFADTENTSEDVAVDVVEGTGTAGKTYWRRAVGPRR